MFGALKGEYEIETQIGQGRFGTVHRGSLSLSSLSSVAVKTLDRRSLLLSSADPLDAECLSNEPKILSLLSSGSCHPNVLRLLGIYEDDDYVHVVTEICEGGDLFERMGGGGRRFSEREAAGVFMQLVSAVAYCHRLGVAHRDIKPDNILFDSRNKLKLADFGSADWFYCGGERIPLRGVVGTPYYVAPEVLAGRDYNEKADIWSAGVILYIMLAGFAPFYGETPVETFEAVLRGNLRFPTRVFRSVSPEAKDLLRKMICKDVSKRLSAEQVLRHPWIINEGDTGSMTDLA